MPLTWDDVLALRMRSLLLPPTAGACGQPGSVAEVVTWFGAMQAQDLGSGLWSLGARLPRLTLAGVVAAMERREALRTWPMRGTVHLVPAADARWMLDLTGAKALAGAASRRAYLGLTERDADGAVEALATALAGGGRLTRAQCLAAIAGAGIDCSGQLGYHLLWYASQRGVTCIAPNLGSEQTFVLLDEWVPGSNAPDREQALATLAVRYFRSHGPTTRQDFAGWTGLSAAECRRAIGAAGDALTTVEVDGRQLLLDPALLDAEESPAGGEFLALPGFDEYLLGFKDRSLMVAAEHRQAIVPGNNGMFRATLVRDGRVVGTWTKVARKGRTVVTVAPLVALTPAQRAAGAAAFGPYERYLEHPVEVTWA